ncbi:hypothetical protein BCR39DRAFT_559870 [Naematelia encephala]|uniref:Uncharacterized protein n=1 Tax=Naematelia encephala TaxID=71784 RepID=A0A1Y2AZQ4_9TREE|nr:hypothetical protein BCR39DRAFT_559870 [Naematelia encephala]
MSTLPTSSARSDRSPTAETLEKHPPPTRFEYAAYASMLLGQKARHQANLARDLASRNSSASAEVNGQEAAQPHSALSTSWPLASEDLPPPAASLSEAITAFASAYIRKECVQLPNLVDDGDDGPTLPLGLIKSTSEFATDVLARAAILRPEGVSTERSRIHPTSWQNILGIVSLSPVAQDIIQTASTRLRAIYDGPAAQDSDLLTHRLMILHCSLPRQMRSVFDDELELYETVAPKTDRKTRPHQSEAEQEERLAKRQIRLEIRQLKANEREKRKQIRRVSRKKQRA